jgi:hypothetical protein
MAREAEPEVFGEIDAVIRQSGSAALGVVAAADKLQKMFASAGLMYEMDVNPRQVGFDPSNRDGEGGNTKEVLALAEDILSLGWSWAATAHAICVEVTPGDQSVEEFNRALCKDSGLAPVEPDSIHFGSLSCGHTNMGLRAIAAGGPSDSAALSENGVLSLAKLERVDAEYALAVRRGLHWQVLRHDVRRRFPDALGILQAAPTPWAMLRTTVVGRGKVP